MRVIGLMSGTSLDGVDAACIETDGERVLGFGRRLTLAYPEALRGRLRALLERAPGLWGQADAELAEVEAAVTRHHAAAIAALGEPAELVGFHGQTIFHAPDRGITWQIGDAALLARLTGLAVAYDFRSQDVAAGGQGAPLVPVFHQALAAGMAGPVVVLNIGGVANITYIDGDLLLACDTGPGCALLDDYCARVVGEPVDRDGRLAAQGRVDEAVLGQLMAHPYFALPAPKSLDRLAFAGAQAAVAGLRPADAAASLVAFTAAAAAAAPWPRAPARVLVTGGGRHHPGMMAALAQRFGVEVAPVEAVGWDGDALEAQCFGFLAARVLRGLPLSFPGTTGVPAPQTGGRLVRP